MDFDNLWSQGLWPDSDSIEQLAARLSLVELATSRTQKLMREAPSRIMVSKRLARQLSLRVRRLWLSRLKEVGPLCEGFVGRRSYMVRCAPSTTRHPETLKSCRRRTFCPFCWASFNAVSLLSAMMELRQRQRNAYKMIEFHDFRYDSVGLRSPSQALANARSNLRDHRHRFGSEEIGSYHLTSVEPHSGVEDMTTDWKTHQRALFVVRPAGEDRLPALIDAGSVIAHASVHDSSVSDVELASIVGRVCSYPGGMLLGRAADVADLLNARGFGQGVTTRLAVRYKGLIHRSNYDA